MNNYVLSCCSTADLSKEHFDNRNIKYLCFHYAMDKKEYVDDLGISMSFPDFYQAMRDGVITKTSQPNVDEFIEHFTPILESGKDILHVTLSSGLSGVINSANIAKEQLEAKYPDRKIYVVDSLGASSGYGLIMETLADLRDEGYTLDDLKAWVDEHKLEMHHWFFSTDLTFYVRGGRISKAAGWFGTALHICPLLNMGKAGTLVPRFKIKGKKAVMRKIVQKMQECAKDGLDYSGKCFISQSDCMDDAMAVAKMVEDTFPKLNGKVDINNIGTTIGSHTGPGTIALFFWGFKRND